MILQEILRVLNPNKPNLTYKPPKQKQEPIKLSAANTPLKSHPLINELLLILIKGFHYKIVDDALNKIVQEYFEIINGIISESKEYSELLTIVEAQFKRHGWDKNSFTKAPDIKLLMTDLQDIYCRIFIKQDKVSIAEALKKPVAKSVRKNIIKKKKSVRRRD